MKTPLYPCTFLLLLFVPGVFAEEAPRRIHVSGEGSAALAPDMAVLTMTVNREAPTAREAVSASSRSMAAVIESMLSLGIAERDLQTAGFSIQPAYKHTPRTAEGGGERKLVGYTVRNTLTVRVRDITRVGEILDTAVTLGVNEGGDIQFTNDDPSAALTSAREKAVVDATAKARTLAAAAGVGLGDVVEISEHSLRRGPIPVARAEMAMDAAGAVPIASGENTYQVNVNMIFAIAP